MAGAPGTFRVAFICGGAKSGKSRLAQNLAESLPGPRLYVATGEALDEEMQVRIARHQQERGPDWETREEPLALAPGVTGNRRPLRCHPGGLFDHVVNQPADPAGG